ncbi:MAG: hypothetical protein HQM08_02450 [Candidatus Riflebacteria bacterium]|nr:hypothetical protein [Candidatus Riflebacteria bacterium]
MVNVKKEFIPDQKFFPQTCRHTMNGKTTVLHCHHYASLYSQLADDCNIVDAKNLLAEVAEDTFYDVFKTYFQENKINDLPSRISIIEHYYALVGLGKMHFLGAGPNSGDVELIHSHIDEGWIKKWGKREAPVNFITCGFICGAFAAIFNQNLRSFLAQEVESIVSGKERSVFSVVRQ